MLNQKEHLHDNSLLKAKITIEQSSVTDKNLTLEKEARLLAQQLFGNNMKKCEGFINRLMDIFVRAREKDFLLIHNPGGWGDTTLDELIWWEKSLVDGVTATIEQQGYSWLLVQYFRSGGRWWSHLRDMKKQFSFHRKGKSPEAKIMAAELRFITQHNPSLKLIMIGVSQGAAFGNAVMQQLEDVYQIYSIELGTFFPYMPHRVLTERTLAIDSNGVIPDPVANGNLKAGFKAYVTAPFRWLKYRLHGKPAKFTYCINVPGHDYSWEYPEVRRKVENFLNANFGVKNKVEVRLS